MGSAGAAGRATWVLAWSLLAAALALPAGPGGRGWHPAGRGLLGRPLGGQPLPDPPAAPGAGPERTAQVRRARPQSPPGGLLLLSSVYTGGGEAPWSWGDYRREGGQCLSRMLRVFFSVWRSGPQSPRKAEAPRAGCGLGLCQPPGSNLTLKPKSPVT